MHTFPMRYVGHSHEESSAPVETGTKYMPSLLLTVFGGVFAATLAVYSSDDVVKIIAAIAAATVAVVGALGLWCVRILNAMAEKHTQTIKAMEMKQAETIGVMKQKVSEAIKESPIPTSPEEKTAERKAIAVEVKKLDVSQASENQQQAARNEPAQPR